MAPPIMTLQAFVSRHLVTAEGVRPAALLVEEGRIQAVTAADQVPAHAQIHDFGEAVILPGLVDSHVHINEPGRTDWEGFANATRGAAARCAKRTPSARTCGVSRTCECGYRAFGQCRLETLRHILAIAARRGGTVGDPLAASAVPRIRFPAAHCASLDMPRAERSAHGEVRGPHGKCRDVPTLFVPGVGRHTGRSHTIQMRAADSQPGELRKTMGGAPGRND